MLRGRSAERARVLRALSAVDGALRLVTVEGAGGLGKSSLLHEVVGAWPGPAHRCGADASASDMPYLVLDELLAGIGSAARGADAIEALLDECEHSTALEPLLLVVDDAQWLDPASAAALASLLRRAEPLPVSVLLASRPAAPAHVLPLLARADERVVLEPLDGEAIAQLAGDVLGRPASQVELERLQQGSAGNPLVLGELLRGVRDGQLDGPVPQALVRAVEGRLLRGGSAAVDVVRACAVLGPATSVERLVAVTERPFDEVTEALVVAEAAGVLIERAGTPRIYHDVVAEVLVDALPPAEARALNRRAGDVLAATRAEPLEVATRLARGAEPGDRDAAVRIIEAALDAGRADPATSISLLHAARSLLPGDREHTAKVDALTLRHLLAAGRHEEAAGLAERLPLALVPLPLAVEAVQNASYALWLVGRARAAAALVAVGTARVDFELVDRLRLDAFRRACLGVVDIDAALDGLDELLQHAEDARAVEAQLILLEMLSTRLLVEGETAGLDAILSQQRQLLTASPGLDPTWTVEHEFAAAFLAVERDDFAAAAQGLEQGLAYARASGLSGFFASTYHNGRGALARAMGDWDEAEVQFATGLAVEIDRNPGGLHASRARLGLAGIAAARGASDRAQDLLAGPLDASEATAAHRLAVQACLDTGAARATAALLEAWERVGRTHQRFVLRDAWLQLARSARAAGDAWVRQAAPVIELLATAAARSQPLRALGLHLRGLLEDDAALLAEALRAYDTSSSRPVDRAFAALDLAELLARAGESAQAAGHAREAAPVLTRVGDARARRAVEIAGARVAEPRPVIGWASLTATEQRVAEMVGRGLLNGEIAAEMVVSKRTIESHVAALFRKLQVSSRPQLVLAAAAHVS